MSSAARPRYEYVMPGEPVALSVVASVLAVFIASRAGFTTAFLTGIDAYAVALACIRTAVHLHPEG